MRRQGKQKYNKELLKKATQLRKDLNKKKPSRTMFKQVMNEIEGPKKEEEAKKEEEEVYNPESAKSDNENEEEPKKAKEKTKKERLLLNERTLLYSENGLKKFYEMVQKEEFKDSDNTKNLSKLTNMFKNWHFMLYPNYDMGFFSQKVMDLGSKSSVRAYLSRLRKIYKGEENWDIMYEEQDLILGQASVMRDKSKTYATDDKSQIKTQDNKLDNSKADNSNRTFKNLLKSPITQNKSETQAKQANNPIKNNIVNDVNNPNDADDDIENINIDDFLDNVLDHPEDYPDDDNNNIILKDNNKKEEKNNNNPDIQKDVSPKEETNNNNIAPRAEPPKEENNNIAPNVEPPKEENSNPIPAKTDNRKNYTDMIESDKKDGIFKDDKTNSNAALKLPKYV